MVKLIKIIRLLPILLFFALVRFNGPALAAECSERNLVAWEDHVEKHLATLTGKTEELAFPGRVKFYSLLNDVSKHLPCIKKQGVKFFASWQQKVYQTKNWQDFSGIFEDFRAEIHKIIAAENDLNLDIEVESNGAHVASKPTTPTPSGLVTSPSPLQAPKAPQETGKKPRVTALDGSLSSSFRGDSGVFSPGCFLPCSPYSRTSPDCNEKQGILFVGVETGRPEIEFLCAACQPDPSKNTILAGAFAAVASPLVFSGYTACGVDIELIRSTLADTRAALNAAVKNEKSSTPGQKRKSTFIQAKVDGTRLKDSFPKNTQFMHIVWIGPAVYEDRRSPTPMEADCRKEKNKDLIVQFIKSATEILAKDGTIHIVQQLGDSLYPSREELANALGPDFRVTDYGEIRLEGRQANNGKKFAVRHDHHLTFRRAADKQFRALGGGSPLSACGSPLMREATPVGLSPTPSESVNGMSFSGKRPGTSPSPIPDFNPDSIQ